MSVGQWAQTQIFTVPLALSTCESPQVPPVPTEVFGSNSFSNCSDCQVAIGQSPLFEAILTLEDNVSRALTSTFVVLPTYPACESCFGGICHWHAMLRHLFIFSCLSPSGDIQQLDSSPPSSPSSPLPGTAGTKRKL